MLSKLLHLSAIRKTPRSLTRLNYVNINPWLLTSHNFWRFGKGRSCDMPGGSLFMEFSQFWRQKRIHQKRDSRIIRPVAFNFHAPKVGIWRQQKMQRVNTWQDFMKMEVGEEQQARPVHCSWSPPLATRQLYATKTRKRHLYWHFVCRKAERMMLELFIYDDGRIWEWMGRQKLIDKNKWEIQFFSYDFFYQKSNLSSWKEKKFYEKINKLPFPIDPCYFHGKIIVKEISTETNFSHIFFKPNK